MPEPKTEASYSSPINLARHVIKKEATVQDLSLVHITPWVRSDWVLPWSVSGYRWERQLVFRSKLTMHTAFDRKDNTHPAEVTALGVSK